MSLDATRRSPDVVGEAAEPIAIVGAACRFPGADGLKAFWQLLHDGVDAIRPIEREGLETSRFYDARPRTPGRMATRWGGFLDGIEQFDADFFGISPREAEKLDPAQRIFLEAAWEACEDAGIDTASLAGKPVGVFVGQWLSDFESRLFADLDDVDFYATTGSGRYATAGRLSYILGVTGPSISVDTACSSSLVAVHLACQSLRSGETPLAFAAGVNVILQPHITVAYSQSGMMAADGHCKFGDAEGDGYVRSEGVGVLVLKRLSEALADGDAIHAVIRGSAVNNDGRGSGHLATPSREGQAEMLRTAYANAGVAPSSVSYVEAHGTGTRVGDPVELGALGDVLTAERAASARCYVGSVKTNVGHTEGAAGLAGIIKAMLALEHEEIPASLHLRTPNPAVPWAELPFEIPKRGVAWSRGGQPRIAGISAFGIAGTNAHIVIEEAPVVARRHSANADSAAAARPLVLSAASRTALRALATTYADRIGSGDDSLLGDVVANAALHRTALPERAVFVAHDRAAFVEKLRVFATGDDQAADVVRRAGHEGKRRVAFVFPGQGGQWIGMGRELLDTNKAFDETIARCDAALPQGTAWNVRGQLLAEPGERAFRLDEIAVLQPVLVAVEIALAEAWRALGVEPEAVVGHSMGEVGAAYFAGALSLEDAMRIICERSQLLQRTTGAGAMAVLELSADETAERIAVYGKRLCVAVVNGPRSTVISGDPQAVADVRMLCDREGIFCRAVQVDVASHSPQMDPLVPELVSSLARIRPHNTATALYSTVDGTRRDGTSLTPQYWGRNMRSTVQFASAVERMLADGIDTFIEVSPHPALLVSIAQVADARRATDAEQRETIALPTLRRNEPENATLLTALGGLWAAGEAVDWSKIFPRDSYDRITLPTYPWQRERHWPELLPVGAAAAPAAAAQPVLDGTQRDWMYATKWKSAPVQAADASRRWLVVGNPRETRPLGDALVKRGSAASLYATVDEAARALRVAPVEDREVGIAVIADIKDPQLAWGAVESLKAFQNAHGATKTPPRIWWVTRGAHRVNSEVPSSRAAEQAALWGGARVLATEHPDWWGGLVDLESENALQSQSDALAAHLGARRDEDQVALRGSSRFALRLTRVGAAFDGRAPSFPWRADGAYLITGAFGGVGRQIALEMVRQGARRLVLLSRSALPPRGLWSTLSSDTTAADRVAFVRSLEHAGASVHLIYGDAADDRQLESALNAYAAEGWPSIVGVVHAAAVLENHLTADMSAERFARVIDPKLNAAIALDRLLPKLDLFVLFSSMSAYWAPAGMANYVAANAGLDALAVARRARGQPAVSIQWGPWEDLGLHRNVVGDRSLDDLTREGVAPLPPQVATRFFAPVVTAYEPVVSIVAIDWSKFAAARRGREPALFNELLVQPTANAVASSDSLRERLVGASDLTRRGMIESAVRGAVSAVLRRPAEQLDVSRPFGTMGLDSLMALELRNRLESAIERSLPATIAWNYPTLTALVSHLDTLVAEDIAAAPTAAPLRVPAAAPVPAARAETSPPSAPAPAEPARDASDDKSRESGGFGMDALFGDVAELSDEDAARALRRGA